MVLNRTKRRVTTKKAPSSIIKPTAQIKRTSTRKPKNNRSEYEIEKPALGESIVEQNRGTTGTTKGTNR